MMNMKLEELSTGDEENLRKLLVVFPKITSVSGALLRNQVISKQLFYNKCDEVIDDLYERSVQFRISHTNFGEEDDEFDMFYSFILDQN